MRQRHLATIACSGKAAMEPTIRSFRDPTKPEFGIPALFENRPDPATRAMPLTPTGSEPAPGARSTEISRRAPDRGALPLRLRTLQ